MAIYMFAFQFSEENDKNGEEKSNSAVQIEDDGPSETFKDEDSKVNHIDLWTVVHLKLNIRNILLTWFYAFRPHKNIF